MDPSALTDEGKACLKRATATLLDRGQLNDSNQDALVRYVRAVDTAERLYQEWISSGQPTTSLGGATGKSVVAHPLIKAIADAEALACRFGEKLGLDPVNSKKTGRPGRPAGSAHAPDRTAVPKHRKLKAI